VLQELKLKARIVDQFANTEVTSKMYNPSPMPQEASFTFLIPDNALVSNLTMTVDNVVYVAKPQHNTTAQTSFLAAKGKNSSAILLSLDKVTGQNEVKILAYLQGFQTVTFSLTYEEYIFKKNGTYSHSLNIASEVSVELVEAVVMVIQHKVIAQIKTANRACEVVIISPKKTKASATTKSSPRCPIQTIGSDRRINLDLSVQYTLTGNGTIDLVTDGSYFAHFFSPETLTTFPKHVVCITDVSMDLGGKNFQQMQDTLIRIFNSLTDDDTFQLITFNNRETNKWPNHNSSIAGTESNKQNAIVFVRRLNVGRGGRNINQMLLAGIEAASHGNLNPNTKQMIFYLTDGSPITANEKLRILKNVWRANYQHQFPIHAFAFGSNPDLDIIELMTLQNQGKIIR
jgi:hypothetical protein